MIVLLVYNINVGQILKEWYCINTENIVIVIQFCLQKWCILNSLWYLNIDWYILVDIECYLGIYGKKGPNETNSVLCSILYSDSHMTWKSHDRSGIFTVQYCTCVVWSVAVKTTVSMTVTCLTISLVKHCIVENGHRKFARST